MPEAMDKDDLRRIITQYLLPMFPGSRLLGRTTHAGPNMDAASFNNPCEILVRPSNTFNYRFTIQRSQPFSYSDVMLCFHFMGVIGEILPVFGKRYFEQLMEGAVARAVSHCVGQSQIVYAIIRQFDMWASQTYEGQQISCAIGIDPKSDDTSGPHLRELWREDFSAVLTGGLETLLVVNKRGHVVAYKALTDVVGRFTAPLRFAKLAGWSSITRIVLALNRNGETLVFKKHELVFAKRRGVWHHFTHDSLAQRMGQVGSRELRNSVYDTCLDVAFARTGGCISLVKSSRRNRVSTVVDDDDLLARRRVTKSKCIDTIVNRPFHKLDRRLRQELAAIDGATIIDHNGLVLAVGAIVEIPRGSRSGARRAAATTLARLGCAIKISADGGILAFRDTGPDTLPEIAFEVA